MSLPRIVVDNSAILPAYFPEAEHAAFDAKLVTNRARALVHRILMGRVKAFVPPSFYREFLNVSTLPLYAHDGRGRNPEQLRRIRAQWDDLLLLPLIVVPLGQILHHSGTLAFDDGCPAADAWYVAAAVHSQATLWISHAHSDDLLAAASKHVSVRLLARHTVEY